MKKITFAGLALMALSFGASAGADPAAAYQAALKQAETALKQASTVGGEWRDTGMLLKSAGKAAESGDFAKAEKLANTARMQSEMGYQQALAQQGKDLTPAYLK
jgi:hypothetical protein